jgi:hypothetical protein
MTSKIQNKFQLQKKKTQHQILASKGSNKFVLEIQALNIASVQKLGNTKEYFLNFSGPYLGSIQYLTFECCRLVCCCCCWWWSRFFAIPCCMFTFGGQRFQKNGKGGKFLTYLNHITEIGQACGFEVNNQFLIFELISLRCSL